MKLILRQLFCFITIIAILRPEIYVQAQEAKEEFEFQTEVGRLMDILINSLYTHKEIFLREIISNASDAIDKMRFLSVANPDLLGDQREFKISVEFDKEAKTLSITDNGLGMTKNDLISNLGTIAKSGTTNFMEAIKDGNLNIIGQFGVGFYSSFLVAQKVEVTSKNNDDDQWIWISSAANSFSIQKDPQGNTLGRGTRITLYLKQDAEEFIEEKTLKELIKKYSEFINFPIYLRGYKKVDEQVPIDGEYEEVEGELVQKTKKVKVEKENWQLMNDNKAIWTRPRDEIEDEEYVNFYKALTKDYEDPLNWIHFKAEGDLSFTSLLYIPSKAPYEMMDNYYGASDSLKLYVRRVLINEEFEELMPRYLSFVKGVIDSDDLPINVSRESIQQLKMLKVISKKLVKKTLDMIEKMSKAYLNDDEESSYEEYSEEEEEEEQQQQNQQNDKQNKNKGDDEEKEEELEDEEQNQDRKLKKIEQYNQFWKEFGKQIKLGVIEDSNNKEKLARISRWYSSNDQNELISFDQYIERMRPGQDQIYFLAGETREIIMQHPSLQKLLKAGYEVLLLDDPIDEFAFQHLHEFEKKKLSNVGRGDFKFPTDSEEERQRNKGLKKLFRPLTRWWKELLSDDLEEVRVSQRLVQDPCLIVSSEQGYSANMDRIAKAQAYGNSDKNSPYSNSKRILEINPSHPAIQELLERVREESIEEGTDELAQVLYEGALVNSGYSLRDYSGFSKRFYRLFNGALGLPRDANLKEIEVDLEEQSDDEPQNHSDIPNPEEMNLDDFDFNMGSNPRDDL